MFIVSTCKVLLEKGHYPEDDHRPELLHEPIMPRSNRPQEATAITDTAPSDDKGKCQYGNSQPTSVESILERRYPIRIRNPPVKYGAS